jgi:hypothetical protein
MERPEPRGAAGLADDRTQARRSQDDAQTLATSRRDSA